MNSLIENPFQIITPEDLDPHEAVDLFVDDFTDFPQIIASGHMFLIGPRGIGKSMMFRYLQADCQCIVKECTFAELPFIGIYIPIKNESFVKTELKRLENRHASEIFNEHLMISHMSVKIFESILKSNNAVECIDSASLYSLYKDTFLSLIYPYNLGQVNDICSCDDILKNIIAIMNNAYKEADRYVKRLSFTKDLPIYEGPLFDYQDFLVPLLSNLENVKGFSKGTIYLLIDDAHFLSEVQTHILNSWIATRTSRKISLKISSQYNYKNYYTVTGATIDTPHDYTEIDMTTIYTNTAKGNYKKRIQSIVNKRLKLASISVSAEDFFPTDRDQENEILKIAEEYKVKFDQGKGRGNKRSDDANRYARADYIKRLAGTSKSSSSYSYSGFDQLVHLSSGIVRHFLNPAYVMYSKERANKDTQEILSISSSVQNDVSREAANKFLFNDLEKLKKGENHEIVPIEDIERLSNLVQGLGGLFRKLLLSERSERRVFSIAISDTLSDNVEQILEIGVNFGYFHRSTIGRKDSKSGGRTRLYVMNRRLAPIWNLDPTGFAGYLFVKNFILEEGIENPIRMLRRVENNEIFQDLEQQQLNLFGSQEESLTVNSFEESEGE